MVFLEWELKRAEDITLRGGRYDFTFGIDVHLLRSDFELVFASGTLCNVCQRAVIENLSMRTHGRAWYHGDIDASGVFVGQTYGGREGAAAHGAVNHQYFLFGITFLQCVGLHGYFLLLIK